MVAPKVICAATTSCQALHLYSCLHLKTKGGISICKNTSIFIYHRSGLFFMRWRWDQGRLDYFRFDNIQKIASCLLELEGVRLDRRDPLRELLESRTRLPFSPPHYTVWRNYARTFRCALLATEIRNQLRTTDICSRLVGGDIIVADEYFTLLIQRFYLPFPAFADYSNTARRQYPMCAVVRYLLAKAISGREASATLEEIFSHVIGNECVGNEPLDFYSRLTPTDRTPFGDEERQVREMLIFLSQFSYLNWSRGRFGLDISSEALENIRILEMDLKPHMVDRSANKGTEIIKLGTLKAGIHITLPERESESDIIFTEGKRIRSNHLRIERNRKVRREFFERLEQPYRCDVCGRSVNEYYPWITNLLQIHHILPLSSPLIVELEGTNLSKLVALCPNCHDAIHRYYRDWLRSKGQEDFQSEEESRQVYEDAKHSCMFD
jgi:5-methylcytosine-specific restriction endonuclease McrA